MLLQMINLKHSIDNEDESLPTYTPHCPQFANTPDGIPLPF